MTTTKEAAMQQALEAIRIFREWEMGQDYHSNRDTVLARAFAAEETLEAALKEPVQEPYAWMAVGGSIWRHKTSEDDVPLYTVPPQRKPLTDEEIRRIYDTHRASVPLYHAIARAIEKAHGIGGGA